MLSTSGGTVAVLTDWDLSCIGPTFTGQVDADSDLWLEERVKPVIGQATSRGKVELNATCTTYDINNGSPVTPGTDLEPLDTGNIHVETCI